jgi:hypothetical protein
VGLIGTLAACSVQRKSGLMLNISPNTRDERCSPTWVLFLLKYNRFTFGPQLIPIPGFCWSIVGAISIVRWTLVDFKMFQIKMSLSLFKLSLCKNEHLYPSKIGKPGGNS